MSERGDVVAGVLIASMFIGCSSARNIGEAAQTRTPQQRHAGVIDHFVPHISTERANKGSRVSLFVRERRGAPLGAVVLFIQGRSAAAVPSFDLAYADYSWMVDLADAGFDVFAMDLQGYGSSSKPEAMDDPCNTSAENQAKYLVPNPLPAPCSPRYPHAFGSFATDWDEIDTVVEFIRSLRGDRALKINLVGWSRGGMRVIDYAALRADNIDKVVALAPTRFPPTASMPSSPMNMTDQRDFFVDWDRQIDSKNCPHQVDPSVRQALWQSTIALDKLGSGWGSVRRSALSCVQRGWMDPRPSGPPSVADARDTRSARRSSARASHARPLRCAWRAEGVRDGELWKPRARLRETAHEAVSNFRGVAPIWHIRGAFAGLDSEVIERHETAKAVCANPRRSHMQLQRGSINVWGSEIQVSRESTTWSW